MNRPDEDTTFIPFIEQTIPKLTAWEYEEYKNVMTSEGFNSATEEQWELFLRHCSKLGNFKKLGEIQLEQSKTALTTNEGAVTTTEYLVPIMFDTGLAHARLSLHYDDDQVKIHGIKYLSDLLMQ